MGDDVEKPGKLPRSTVEAYTKEILDLIDYSSYLPQEYPLTENFMKDVLDPVMTVAVPTGKYRVTMRKLLRLSLSQLQQQAEKMKLDILDRDQEGIATQILVNMTEETPLIPALTHMLLAKEIAYVYGIRFQIPVRSSAHPSSTVMITVKPWDLENYLDISKTDLLDECQNQGIAVNRQESKRQLAVRLIARWTERPDQLRQPFTANFASFLLETARDVSSTGR